MISAVEATVAAIAGVVLGFALFYLLRPVLYRVPLTGAPFSPGDLSLTSIDIAIVIIGVPIAAVVVRTPRAAPSPDLAASGESTSDFRRRRGCSGSFRFSPASPCSPISMLPASRAATVASSLNCSLASCCSS